MSGEAIVVRGARVHNLKNIDVEIPHNALTVVTGVSGSGKSSLAFDTIYAEGQRRYIESLSAYARQFLERIEKPDVDSVDGIAPAIAIRQKVTTRNPRSTVATATEIYDYLRLLFSRVGATHCTECGAEVKRDTVDQILEELLASHSGARMNALFPLRASTTAVTREIPKPKRAARSKAKIGPEEDLVKQRLFDLRKHGFTRLYQNGVIFDFSTPESLLDINFNEPVFILVDRIVVSSEERARIVDAIEICYHEAGEVIFETAARKNEPAQRLRFLHTFECRRCHIRYEDPEPRMFSFNNPFGACPRCQGFGNTINFDMDLVIPDKGRTLAGGAIEPWNKPKYREFLGELKRFARLKNIPTDVPWRQLEHDQRQIVLEGDGRFPGVRGFFAMLERKKYKLHVRVFLSRYRGYALCPMCAGTRLRTEARHVLISGKNIIQICSMSVEECTTFFRDLTLSKFQAEVAAKILEEIAKRLRYLMNVGLDYLTLDRLSSTLSGGETQRIQLASSLGSRLVGAVYILDEPSIGLHNRDTSRLIHTLHELRDLGNTILVVEHDEGVMKASDYILDLGLGAGENGGSVIAAGTFDEIKRNPASLTAKYLTGERRVAPSLARRNAGASQIKIFGATAHNLKNIDVSIPLGMLVAITGVSGSGKSTLVHDVLYQALQGNAAATGANSGFDRVEGAEFIQEVILVDQSPIGRTPRSNPVTYIKAFDAIRDLMASLPESKKRGYRARHFSFNVTGGRCETCQGDGTVTVEMQFLADVELICEECKGTRYKEEVLEVKYKDKNISQILDLTVKEALQFFSATPKITRKLRILDDVGLGYLRLGQSATTLSGGEAQRIKLAAHLAESKSASSGRGTIRKPRTSGKSALKEHRAGQQILYIFDEPTTGLHFDDINKLLKAFRRLLDAGGSIVVIEHNLEVIKTADWIIDLGPEGGYRGGEVVGAGTPEMLAKSPGHTARWLATALNGRTSVETLERQQQL